MRPEILLDALLEEDQRVMEAAARLAQTQDGLLSAISHKLRTETVLALSDCDEATWLAYAADIAPSAQPKRGRPRKAQSHPSPILGPS